MRKHRSRKRLALLAFALLLLGLGLSCFVWIRKEQHQYALNRELIDLLRKDEFKRSLKLVEAGADPNTRVEPVPTPTWQELLERLVKHSEPSSNNSPTAFMIACGDLYLTGGQDFPSSVSRNRTGDPYMIQLAIVMVTHGANVNARDNYNMTALMCASQQDLTGQIALLMKQGALIDLQDDNGDTALHLAVSYNNIASVKLLLKFHANPKLKTFGGITPLDMVSHKSKASPEIIRILKAAGANE